MQWTGTGAAITTLQLVTLLALTGCAAALPGVTSGISEPAAATPAISANGAYVLSADEQKFECKQLMGRMQIRILEIRDYDERNQTSMVSQALKATVKPFFGGGTRGNDPNADYAKDRAMLEAYNKQLAVKGCKTYDLDAQLKPKNFRETPEPITPPSDKKPK